MEEIFWRNVPENGHQAADQIHIEKDFDKVEQLMAYDEGGGMEFENGLLSTSRKTPAALPDRGEPDNPFSRRKQAAEKEPVRAFGTDIR